eukprot:g20463.t1
METGRPEVPTSQDRLLDYFMVVGFDLEEQLRPKWQDESSDDDGSVLDTRFTAEVLDRYPRQDHPGCPLPLGVDSFCFPKGLKLSSRDDHARVHYFVTTGGYGEEVYRLYACALTLMERVPSALLPNIYSSLVMARRTCLANPAQVEDSEQGGEQDFTHLMTSQNHPASLWGPWSSSFSPQPSALHAPPPSPHHSPKLNFSKPFSMLWSSSLSSPFEPFDAALVHPACLLAPSSPGDRTGELPPLFAPKCLVLLSHQPFLQNYRTFLTELYRVSLGQSQFPLERIISNFLVEVPLPPLGRTMVHYTFPSTKKTMIFARPPENDPFRGSPISIRTLFEFLDPENVVFLMEQLLAQNKVVVLSRHLSAVVLFCEALLIMLFPFEFTTNYVPLLPQPMIETLDAPGGGLFGTHEDFVTEDHVWGLEGCVVVQLNNNQLFSACRGQLRTLLDLDAERERLCPFPFPSATRNQIIAAMQPLASVFQKARPVRRTHKDQRGSREGLTASASTGNLRADSRRSSLSTLANTARRSISRNSFSSLGLDSKDSQAPPRSSAPSSPQFHGHGQSMMSKSSNRLSTSSNRLSASSNRLSALDAPFSDIDMPVSGAMFPPTPTAFLATMDASSCRLDDLKRRNDLDMAIEFVPLPDQIMDEEEQQGEEERISQLERQARQGTFKQLTSFFKGYADYLHPDRQEVFDTKAFLATRKSSQRRWVSNFLLTPMWEQFLRLCQLGSGPAAHPLVRYLNESYRPASLWLTDTSRSFGPKPYVVQPLQVPPGTPNIPYGLFPRLRAHLFGRPSPAPNLVGQADYSRHLLTGASQLLLKANLKIIGHDGHVFSMFMELFTQLLQERHAVAMDPLASTAARQQAAKYSHLELGLGMEVLQALQERGLNPHPRLFTMLMSTCAVLKDCGVAMRLYQHMGTYSPPLEPLDSVKKDFVEAFPNTKMGSDTLEDLDKDISFTNPHVEAKKSTWGLSTLNKFMPKRSGSVADHLGAPAHKAHRKVGSNKNELGGLATQAERTSASEERSNFSSRQRARRFEEAMGSLLTIKTSMQCPNHYCRSALQDHDVREGWSSLSPDSTCPICLTRFRAKLQVSQQEVETLETGPAREERAELKNCRHSSEYPYFPPRYLELQLHKALKTAKLMELCDTPWRRQHRDLFVNLAWHCISQGIPTTFLVNVRAPDFLEPLSTDIESVMPKLSSIGKKKDQVGLSESSAGRGLVSVLEENVKHFGRTELERLQGMEVEAGPLDKEEDEAAKLNSSQHWAPVDSEYDSDNSLVGDRDNSPAKKDIHLVDKEPFPHSKTPPSFIDFGKGFDFHGPMDNR